MNKGILSLETMESIRKDIAKYEKAKKVVS